jgi:hypothetical protein
VTHDVRSLRDRHACRLPPRLFPTETR